MMSVEKSLIELGFERTGSSFNNGTGYIRFENKRLDVSLQVMPTHWNLYVKRKFEISRIYKLEYHQGNGRRLNKEKLLKFIELEKEF